MMKEFLTACNRLLWATDLMCYVSMKEKGSRRPQVSGSSKMLSAMKIEKLVSMVFDQFVILSGRTVRSFLSEQKYTQAQSVVIIEEFMEACVRYVLHTTQLTSSWQALRDDEKLFVVESLVDYCSLHPNTYDFDYYQAQDYRKQQQEMQVVELVLALCASMGLLTERVVQLQHTLSRYAITYFPKSRAVEVTSLAFDQSKILQLDDHKLLLGIGKSIMYLRCRGEGWLSDYDSYEKQHVYQRIVEHDLSPLERASILRLEAESMLSIGAASQMDVIRSLLNQAAHFYHSYQTKDTHRWQYLTAEAMVQFYAYKAYGIAKKLFEEVKHEILATKGNAWNHQLIGSVCLHHILCDEYLELEVSDHDKEVVRRVYPHCNFDQYYQLSSPNRLSTLHRLHDVVS